MAFAYVDDFSGGICDRSPASLEGNEMEDSLGCYAQGGVFILAPTWHRRTAAIPAGDRVLAGVGREDGTSVVVLWNATNGYRYHILSAAGAWATPAPRPIPWPAGTAPAAVHGTWSPAGTVLVSDTAGNWPWVVEHADDSLVTLDSKDVRVRREDQYIVGVTTEANVFTKVAAATSTETSSFKNANAITLTAGVRYVSIASDFVFQAVELEFDNASGITGSIAWLDANGLPARSYPGAVSGNRFKVAPDWDAGAMARTSRNAYNASTGATVGVGKFRAVVTLDGTYEGRELRSVTVSHEQYFRTVLDGISPHIVALHRDRVVFGFNNAVQFGFTNRLNGWEPRMQDYFAQGGDRITALKSHGGYLLAMLENGIHAITGNSDDTWGKQMLADYVGTTTPDSLESIMGMMLFADAENRLSVLQGQSVRQVTRHCKKPMEAERMAGTWAAHVLEYDKVIVLARRGAGARAFIMDPDTMRPDRGGGFKVSVYPVEAPAPDPPAPIEITWVDRDRTPHAVAGNRIYTFDGAPAPSGRRSWVKIPLYAGGDPSGHMVKRVTVRVSYGADDPGRADDLVIEFYRAEVLAQTIRVDAEVVEQSKGIIRRAVVPARGVATVKVDTGRRRLFSITIDYHGRPPGGHQVQVATR